MLKPAKSYRNDVDDHAFSETDTFLQNIYTHRKCEFGIYFGEIFFTSLILNSISYIFSVRITLNGPHLLV
ncbi:hypothetical protein OKW21_000203 [Catalinimonas alkaloidigena]|nr:hypothetical protein [Catalinimonas alkaloidigena]